MLLWVGSDSSPSGGGTVVLLGNVPNAFLNTPRLWCPAASLQESLLLGLFQSLAYDNGWNILTIPMAIVTLPCPLNLCHFYQGDTWSLYLLKWLCKGSQYRFSTVSLLTTGWTGIREEGQCCTRGKVASMSFASVTSAVIHWTKPVHWGSSTAVPGGLRPCIFIPFELPTKTTGHH